MIFFFFFSSSASSSAWFCWSAEDVARGGWNEADTQWAARAAVDGASNDAEAGSYGLKTAAA